MLSDVGKKAENICKYDLDDLDFHWLAIFNERRDDFGMLFNFFKLYNFQNFNFCLEMKSVLIDIHSI